MGMFIYRKVLHHHGVNLSEQYPVNYDHACIAFAAGFVLVMHEAAYRKQM